MTKPMRFLRTVRHLGMRQVATRAIRVAERAWWRATRAATPSAPAFELRAHERLMRELPEDVPAIERAAEVMAGRFTFLGETRACSWAAADASHLWRFHLHYFDYARDLAVYALHRDRASAYRTFRELVTSWIDAHTLLGGDAWHPYTISLRIVNWCEAAIVFRPELEGNVDFAKRMYDSIAAQAEFLSGHLEHDVRGNHLLENARALLRTSMFFEGAASLRWRSIALDLLKREIPEQILDDGGHFERSPGYHARVLEVVTDATHFLPANWMKSAVERMQAFLDVITPPNGRLPLLKDTVLAPVSTSDTPQSSRWLEPSGYAVIRDDARGDHLIADFGRVCPDYLPAHAHADMFSYELTVGGKPVIVDSGVFEYAEGQWRTWFRSTAAHNTVDLDGRDQSEMWGSFRVGRRARVRNVTWRETPEMTSIDGIHDGYAPLLHRRVIIALHEPRLWIVLDHVSGAPGHIARSFIHLHPEHAQLAFTPLGAVTLAETSGWYSEHFGVKQTNRVIMLASTTPAWFGYVIAAAEPPPQATMTERDDHVTVEIATGRWRGTVHIGEAGAITAP
jgi:uncharacterized heparinase superfamily protein